MAVLLQHSRQVTLWDINICTVVAEKSVKHSNILTELLQFTFSFRLPPTLHAGIRFQLKHEPCQAKPLLILRVKISPGHIITEFYLRQDPKVCALLLCYTLKSSLRIYDFFQPFYRWLLYRIFFQFVPNVDDVTNETQIGIKLPWSIDELPILRGRKDVKEDD